MTVDTPRLYWRSFFRTFLLMMIPALLICGAGFYHFYEIEWQADLKLIKMEAVIELARQQEIIRNFLHAATSDLFYLSNRPGFKAFTATLDSATRAQIEEDWTAFARYHSEYLQIRYLNREGKEVIRINNTATGPKVVDEEPAFQDKSSREYFRETIALAPNQVYLSRFDLNQENGTVEMPFQPVLRLAQSVAATTENTGVIILNINGHLILDQLRKAGRGIPGNPQLIDHAGYWLLHPAPEKEWGFMFADARQHLSLKREDAGLWKRLMLEDKGQAVYRRDQYLWTTIYPHREVTLAAKQGTRVNGAFQIHGLSGECCWKLILHLTDAMLVPQKRELQWRFLKSGLALSGLLACACFGIAWTRMSRHFSRLELARANEKLSETVRKLQHSNTELGLISDMGEYLQACETEIEICEIACQYAQLLLPDHVGAIYLSDKSGTMLTAAVRWGHWESGDRIAMDACRAARTGEVHTGCEKNCPVNAGKSCAGSLCIPVNARGENIGLLFLRPEEPDRAQEKDAAAIMHIRQLAAEIADRAALMVISIRLLHRLHEKSIRDALTGLYNRRYLEDSLVREIRRAERRKGTVSLIMFDVDHFKKLNDTYGHDAGDQVLKEIGRTVLEAVRREDIPCRYGGEEFLLILPDAKLEDAARRAEELRGRFADIVIPWHGEELHITVSLGVAAYPDHGASPGKLIAVADGALYQAKEQGRNRVVTAPLPEPAA
jgi:diguanylate cyclase (GGDEF)-like protein